MSVSYFTLYLLFFGVKLAALHTTRKYAQYTIFSFSIFKIIMKDDNFLLIWLFVNSVVVLSNKQIDK